LSEYRLGNLQTHTQKRSQVKGALFNQHFKLGWRDWDFPQGVGITGLLKYINHLHFHLCASSHAVFV